MTNKEASAILTEMRKAIPYDEDMEALDLAITALSTPKHDDPINKKCEFCGDTRMVCYKGWEEERDKLKAEIKHLSTPDKVEMSVGEVEKIIAEICPPLKIRWQSITDIATAIVSRFKVREVKVPGRNAIREMLKDFFDEYVLCVKKEGTYQVLEKYIDEVIMMNGGV